jgi:hypothetical protein
MKLRSFLICSMAQQGIYCIYLSHQLENVLIVDSFGANLRLTNNKLTYGHTARLTMLLLHATRLENALLSRLCNTCIIVNSELADLFQGLKKFLDNFVCRSYLILNFKDAIYLTFNTGKRKDQLLHSSTRPW